jgi:hypothetical protein
MDGDAFVVAPDNSRCGLVWDVGGSPPFEEVRAPESSRWGVWGVSFEWPMTSKENACKNLGAVLPLLKVRWMAWKESQQSRNDGDSELRSE